MDDAKNIGKIAESHFENGLLCAESVVTAIADYHGVDNKLVSKMATAFCGGMARTCGQCGALSGAVMGISLALGRDSKDDTVTEAYEATQELVQRFENEFGARDCHKLLGCDISTKRGMEQFKAQNLRVNCTKYTGKAAEIAVQVLSKNS
ncbi:C-GCAxxG-C-C family protein [Vibrio viridaestus]|uniref:C_GCAxxG_C_C family protein n=1 Tax=Vibrio viridaestus TaxID=2487322 RepID=A0A3N9THR3_9VIBR|nr:C-GCAxxG-C-C family protein [Vibrio viridaestus]RQW63719.1 C_GCAxxG_C_C family protein [Vibrio viridaestus]